MPTLTPLEDIETAFQQVIANEFTFFASFYNKEWHVTLSKHTYGDNPVSLEVKGAGETIFMAVERALNNFPKNPLDGSRWKTTQLAAPVEDGTFTETDS